MISIRAAGALACRPGDRAYSTECSANPHYTPATSGVSRRRSRVRARRPRQTKALTSRHFGGYLLLYGYVAASFESQESQDRLISQAMKAPNNAVTRGT